MDTNEEIVKDMVHFLNVMKEASELRYKKVQMYGIMAYKTFGAFGIVMRLQDKLSRALNFYEAKINNKEIEKTFMQSPESIRDTFIDIMNYSCMAVMLLDNEMDRMQDRLMTPDEDRVDVLPSYEAISKNVFGAALDDLPEIPPLPGENSKDDLDENHIPSFDEFKRQELKKHGQNK